MPTRRPPRRRFVGYLLQPFAITEPDPLPDPPTPTAVYRAMLQLDRG